MNPGTWKRKLWIRFENGVLSLIMYLLILCMTLAGTLLPSIISWYVLKLVAQHFHTVLPFTGIQLYLFVSLISSLWIWAFPSRIQTEPQGN
jgi:hypothetical protein